MHMLIQHTCLQKLFLIALALLAAGCASAPADRRADDVYPDVRSFALPCNVQVVLVPAMKSAAAADVYAVHEAACRIAMMKNLFVFSGQVSQAAGSGERMHDDFSYHYDDTNLAAIEDTLQIAGCRELPDGQRRYLVRDPAGTEELRYNAYAVDLSYFADADSGRPQWVLTPPSGGAFVAYGTAAAHRSLADAVFAADLAAACALVRQGAVAVRNFMFDYNSADPRAAAQHRQGGVSLSAGTVSGFFVIDRWIDPRNGDVYTLAACHSVQKKAE